MSSQIFFTDKTMPCICIQSIRGLIEYKVSPLSIVVTSTTTRPRQKMHLRRQARLFQNSSSLQRFCKEDLKTNAFHNIQIIMGCKNFCKVVQHNRKKSHGYQEFWLHLVLENPFPRYHFSFVKITVLKLVQLKPTERCLNSQNVIGEDGNVGWKNISVIMYLCLLGKKLQGSLKALTALDQKCKLSQSKESISFIKMLFY